MRIKADIRRTVVFLGHASPGSDFAPIGTAFHLGHDRMPYLVTARHIAEQLGDDPFVIRMNMEGGGATNCHYDPINDVTPPVNWFFHEDPNVDVAIMPFMFDIEKIKADYRILTSAESVNRHTDRSSVGCGDFCYVIGLFSLFPGKGRMMPIIHTGHVAMMPDPVERIPTRDWRGPGNIEIEGYLVEISNLQGLSGSPVLVRSGFELELENGPGKKVVGVLGSLQLDLLGVWQGSWDGPQATSLGVTNRVPVGMGVVTPVEKLLELLDSQSVTANRKMWLGEATSTTTSSLTAR